MTKRNANTVAKQIAIYIRQHGYSAPGAIMAVYLHNNIPFEGGAFRFGARQR